MSLPCSARPRVIVGAALTVCLLAAGSAVWTPAHAQDGSSIWDGVYTKDQAERGRELYKANCAVCHGSDRPTGTSMAPALTGADFLANYDAQTVGDLFTKIIQTMPSSSPGTLMPAQAADLIAFLGSNNEWPAGEKELPSDPEALKAIKIVKK